MARSKFVCLPLQVIDIVTILFRANVYPAIAHQIIKTWAESSTLKGNL